MSRFRSRRLNDGYTSIHRDSGFSTSQFITPPDKIPWKAIAFSGCLSGGGTALLIAGLLIATGYIDGKHYDKMWPMIVLGGLMTIPGTYHMVIVYCAYKGYRGYTFSDIPEFD